MSDAPRVGEPDWANAYAGVSVAVLGAAGFIGRWVARALAGSGAEPTLVVRSCERAGPVLDAMGINGRLLEADLGEPGRITELLAQVSPAVTFNLVGFGVDPAETDAGIAERINARLPRALAEACAAIPRGEWEGQSLVHVGSALEYGAAGGSLPEDTECVPTTLYGRTKLAGTLAVREVSEDRGLPAVTARLFTVYGPGEHRGRLLPSLLATAKSGRPLELTEGMQRRDFTFVGDASEGLLRLGLAKPEPGLVVNLATGMLETVRGFAETAARVLEIDPGLLRFGARKGRASEMEHAEVSVARLEALTHWRPPTGIAAGIEATAAFEASVGKWPSD